MTATAIDLYAKQGQFVGLSAHEAAFIGGIGSGKSHAGCVRGLMAALGMVGRHAVRTPNLGVVTAPTYPMLRDATLRTFLDLADAQGLVQQFNKSDMAVTLSNGSEVLFRSTETPDRLRGPSITWWFGDEAAMYLLRVWEVMVGRLRQYGRRGFAWLATTPRGRNWVYQLFVTDAGARRMIHATSRENVFLDESILEAWENTYSGDFAAQELGGEFVAFEGLIYPEFRRELHTFTTPPDGAFVYTVAGMDWGFANPGVLLVFGIDGDGRMWQVAEYYQRQRQIDEWVDVAKQARATWGIKAFYCDPSEPDYIAKMRAAGLPAEQANNSVQPGIQAVKARLMRQADRKPRLLVRSDCVWTISEYESYQWAENRYGIKDEPLKTGDHAMDAQRYAVMGVDAGRKPVTATVTRWA